MNYCQKKISEGGLGDLNFPLLSDQDRQISVNYGVYIEEDSQDYQKGACYRSTFIIDQNLILRHISINDISISVNPDEILRLVNTFQQNDKQNPQQRPSIIQGCPFANQMRQRVSNPDIDTFSRYQKKKVEIEDENDQKVKDFIPPNGRQSVLSNSNKLNTITRESQQKDLLKINKESQKTLFDRLGGDEQIEELTDRFVQYMFQDSLLKSFFMNTTNQSKQKKLISAFFKSYFGSGVRYQGKSMQESHKNLNLNDDHFNKSSECLKQALKELKYSPQLIQDVMIFVEPLRSQITQRPCLSLYDRVGGEQGIQKSINAYFDKIMNIKEIRPYYSKVDLEKTKDLYIQYISLVFGGPKKYLGKQMKQCHQSYNIPDKLFNYCVAQIQQCFKENGVETNNLNEIGRLLECLKYEIPKKSNILFDRLGGTAILQKVVKKLYEEKVLHDPKLKDFFKNINIDQLQLKLVEFFTMITGGAHNYQGKSAKDAHKTYNIMSFHFDIYKNHLKDSLLEFCQNKEAITEFLNLLDTLRVDIIGGKPPSLFEKMGGEDAINAFAEGLFTNIMNERRIRHYFENVDLKPCKQHFKEFLYMTLGGPSKYSGENVRELHEQMDISTKDFNVFKELVEKTVPCIGIEKQNQIELIQFFESMRQMIVTVD
ncbi:protozoan cyanobacterial globin family protein, putative [Ichthyophthirius multifiliis]|uniref:Protozoan cyanobacterial globin family protein, putative n=1 Tax=Ichthyophthirius multifiliis TaxID=5932 RepID=G0QTT0_ICHMU|nr:protozoan cyanobacterial globin family protein, putative [Ichthyophthirius multifiliis]EGR31380.1 protozoan cyanobacterial globin family protein, putative [Ichthyophthirius multifiliis]|eukprot:XP_004034866.1 protozoan cyanobacterial globin family protein, putative [Ichthyophthirius multifiliis]